MKRTINISINIDIGEIEISENDLFEKVASEMPSTIAIDDNADYLAIESIELI